MKEIFLKCRSLMFFFFSLSDIKNLINDLMVSAKNGNFKRKHKTALFEVVFVKCVCIWRTSVFFQFYGVLSRVICNYSPPLFNNIIIIINIIQSHTFAAENCAIGNIVKYKKTGKYCVE